MSLFDALMQEDQDIYKYETIQDRIPEPLVGQLARGLDKNAWDEADATTFNVRGPNFLADRIKYPSGQSACELLDVDTFCCDREELVETLGEEEKVDGAKQPLFFSKHPQSYVRRARDNGDERFFFVVHFDTGTEHVVATFVPKNKPNEEEPQYRCWQRFANGDSEFRKTRFKIIPSCVDGPWIVRKTIGSVPKPAIICNKIDCYWYKNLSILKNGLTIKHQISVIYFF